MTNAETSTLVFKNQAGDYFLLPQATLERGRIPDERKAEVERLVAESAVFKLIEGDEVQGYLAPLAGWLIGCAISGALNAVVIGSGAAEAVAGAIRDASRDPIPGKGNQA